MQSIMEGQFVRHAQYGLGVVTQSDDEHTSIDFHLHGPKKFATGLMTMELTDGVPPPKPRPPKRGRASTHLPPVSHRQTRSELAEVASITWHLGRAGLWPRRPPRPRGLGL